jgi:hypothetical protein
MKGKYITNLSYGQLFHIFDSKDNISLCGKVAMLRIDESQCDEFKGTEHWKNGQDCKACFKKAGLI